MRGQRPQARQRMRALVVDRDDDAGHGRVAVRHRKRRERAIGRPEQRRAARRRLFAGMYAHPVQGGAPATGSQAGHGAADQAGDALEVIPRVGQ